MNDDPKDKKPTYRHVGGSSPSAMACVPPKELPGTFHDLRFPWTTPEAIDDALRDFKFTGPAVLQFFHHDPVTNTCRLLSSTRL